MNTLPVGNLAKDLDPTSALDAEDIPSLVLTWLSFTTSQSTEQADLESKCSWIATHCSTREIILFSTEAWTHLLQSDQPELLGSAAREIRPWEGLRLVGQCFIIPVLNRMQIESSSMTPIKRFSFLPDLVALLKRSMEAFGGIPGTKDLFVQLLTCFINTHSRLADLDQPLFSNLSIDLLNLLFLANKFYSKGNTIDPYCLADSASLPLIFQNTAFPESMKIILASDLNLLQGHNCPSIQPLINCIKMKLYNHVEEVIEFIPLLCSPSQSIDAQAWIGVHFVRTVLLDDKVCSVRLIEDVDKFVKFSLCLFEFMAYSSLKPQRSECYRIYRRAFLSSSKLPDQVKVQVLLTLLRIKIVPIITSGLELLKSCIQHSFMASNASSFFRTDLMHQLFSPLLFNPASDLYVNEAFRAAPGCKIPRVVLLEEVAAMYLFLLLKRQSIKALPRPQQQLIMHIWTDEELQSIHRNFIPFVVESAMSMSEQDPQVLCDILDQIDNVLLDCYRTALP